MQRNIFLRNLRKIMKHQISTSCNKGFKITSIADFWSGTKRTMFPNCEKL